MDPLLFGTAAAFGLATSAGLNTTLPLLIVAALGRAGLLALNAPYDALTGDIVIAGLMVLSLLELAADKIPGLDSVAHTVQWPLAAAAGAILFASQNSAVSWVAPELAVLVGLLTAGGVHGLRAAVRPGITAASAGLGNGIASLVEDGIAVALTLASAFAPIVALVLLTGVIVLLVLGATRIARRGPRLTAWLRLRRAGRPT